MANITIIEPHALLRLGLLQLISDLGTDIYLHSRDYPKPGDDRPDWPTDVALLSISHHDHPDGTEGVIASIEDINAPNRIIALGEASHMPSDLIPLAHRLAGYLPKSSDPHLLHAAIKLVMAGGACFPSLSDAVAGVATRAPIIDKSTLSEPVRNQAATQGDPVMTSGTPPRWPPAINQNMPGPQVTRKEMTEHELLGLTPRQYEVLVLLARGYPMKTVGRCLNISVATAKAHTETLYQRLDVHNRNAAVYAAVSRGAKLGWECIGAPEDSVLKHRLR